MDGCDRRWNPEKYAASILNVAMGNRALHNLCGTKSPEGVFIPFPGNGYALPRGRGGKRRGGYAKKIGIAVTAYAWKMPRVSTGFPCPSTGNPL
jgi:hypothetical protein